jgi:hypothetical protein
MFEEGAEDRALGQAGAALLGTYQRSVIEPEQPRGQRRVGEVMLRGLTEPVKVVTAGDPWWYLVEQPQ